MESPEKSENHDSSYVKAAKAREASQSNALAWFGCLFPIVRAGAAVYACSGGVESKKGATEAMKVVAAQQAVRQMLRDPDGADFRNERLGSYQGREVVCGEVNSANGFGGKSGFQRYISNGGDVTILEEQMGAAEFSKSLAMFGC